MEKTPGELNAMAELIISRLPKTPIITPFDIASALGFRTAAPVVRKIESGELPALNYGTPAKTLYLIRREAAVEHIKNRMSGTGSF